MFLLSVEAWGEFISNSEKSTARFAIKNIIEELLMPITRAFIINVDRHSMIVFVQPRQAIHGESEEPREAVEKRIRLFVNEMVGDVHKYIRENLGITVSIVTSKDFVGWESAGNKYVTLRIILNSNAGMKNGSITIEKDISDENESIRMSLDKTMNNIRELISRMDDCIQLMQDKEFFALMNFIREVLQIDDGMNRPDAMILCYPVITSGEFAHRGSINNLLGGEADEKLLHEVSLEHHVSEKTPPAFIWHTLNDSIVPAENSLLFANALRKRNIPFELHIYPEGPHGLSLATKETDEENRMVRPHVATWLRLCTEWLETCI